jgi:hypothetical protein
MLRYTRGTSHCIAEIYCIVTNEEANFMMSDPGNFLPLAVKKQIVARTLSGNQFTA